MSKDIRSFFMPKKAPAKPAVTLDDDDDDVIPESPNVQIKNKKKESKKKRCISDSDEEIFETKKKKTDKPSTSANKKNKIPEKPALKEVKVVDMFGSGPIKRTEPLVKKVKKNTETGIHSDEEFEKSLLEVDAEGLALTEKKETSVKETKSISENQKEKSPVPDINKDKSPAPEKKKDKSPAPEKKKDKSPAPEKKKEKSPVQEQKKDISMVPISGDSNKEKHKHSSKDKASHKQNGDSHSQELKLNDHKSKESKHSDSKKPKDIKTEHVTPKKEKKETVSSTFFENKEKKEQDKEKTHKKESSSNTKQNGENTQDRKRDFSEFVDSDISIIEDHDDKHKNKKKKLDKSLNESALTDEERHERRMHSAALYKSYLNRSGPKHLGAKQIPEGTPTCLVNCAFLLTGVLDSFEREEVTEAITRFGGCVKNSMSKKVTHVLAGEDAGPAKMAKAQEFGIKIISEDEFLKMIVELSKKPSSNKIEIKKETKREKSPKKTPQKKESKDKSQERKDKHSSDRDRNKHEKSDHRESKNKDRDKSQEKTKIKEEKSRSPKKDHVKAVEIKSDSKSDIESKSSSSIQEIKALSRESSKSSNILPSNTIMWVEKYKPQNLKQIIGQHGDSSNVKKLLNWLTKWYVNRKAKLPKPSPWAKNDDGGFYKAALLSGPPGVGKTTTVGLVCKELGFDTVEFNASDTRNKTLIKEQIGELLNTTSLSGYAKGETGKQAVTKKHVLVMDEVDGMAGNEDRGGLQELIALIKSTSVPIICMCNDRNSPKMRTLVNYCYDLRFTRPRVEQIKSAMMSVCCKEGVKIPADALTQLIVAANQDIRQTLNLLSMWAIDPSLMDSEKLKKETHSGYKDLKLGPWEVVRKVFSAEDHKTMSLHDKSDLFFYDYSLAPLFVQENYIQVTPHCPKNEMLDRLAKAADSISLGNLVDSRIRSSQAWNLLPVQALYASVIPGHELSGHVSGQINFPAWLGNNSKQNKMHRLCQEIHAHTRLSTSGSKSSIFLDYAPYLRDAIITPLLKEKSEGIEKSLAILESYHLLREDLDSLVELSLWSGQRNPMILIDSKIKAAMTRTYNKKAMALPYAPGAVRRARVKDPQQDDDEEFGDELEEEQDSDVENDALIKKKKVKEEKPSTSKDKAGSSKEKAGPSKDKPGARKKK